MTAPTENRNDIRTPKGRLSFPSVFVPETIQNDDGTTRKEYSSMIIINKGEDISRLTAAVDAILKEKFPKGVPAGVKRPIRDGAEKPHVKGLGEGVWFLTARTKNKPPVVDHNKVAIADVEKVYGGCWGKLNVTPFWFDKGMSKGVSFALNAVQKLGDDEPFAGMVDVDSCFDEEAEVGPTAGESSGW